MDGMAIQFPTGTGRALVVPLGLPLYLPPAFFWWWFAYDAYAPEVFLHGAYIAASGTLVAIVAAIAMSVWRAREAKTVITYGSARWAKPDEVQAAGLLVADGVLLGKLGRAYLRHDGPEHVLCFAPTRSGKGVGLVVPSLLNWAGSAIVHDIKGENWTLTAGFRARFGHALLFDCQIASNRDPSFASNNDPWSLVDRSCGILFRRVGPCQPRFLERQLSLPVSTMSQWWVRRSSMAVVILASPNTCGQSAKARLVVMSSEVFS
jgi:hypothetical protein